MHESTVVAADWSGAAVGEARHLWLAEWDPSEQAVVTVRGLTRQAATERIIDLAQADAGLVAGLDFGFSFPAWWFDAARIDSVEQLWSDAERLERWLAECRPPFWGRPGMRRPPLGGRNEWRRTELAAPVRPRSVFQIGGAGSVGTASLRGMPSLARLQHEGFAVWPFAAWSLPAVVEAWPRLAIGRTVKTSAAARAAWLQGRRDQTRPSVRAAAAASPDAFDAVAAALDLASRAAPRPLLDDPILTLEGWIDGVAIPGVSAGASAG